jgi:hypothetical protein
VAACARSTRVGPASSPPKNPRIMSPASSFFVRLWPSICAGQALVQTATDFAARVWIATQVATHVARLAVSIVVGRLVLYALLLTLKRQQVARSVEVQLELLVLAAVPGILPLSWDFIEC